MVYSILHMRPMPKMRPRPPIECIGMCRELCSAWATDRVGRCARDTFALQHSFVVHWQVIDAFVRAGKLSVEAGSPGGIRHRALWAAANRVQRSCHCMVTAMTRRWGRSSHDMRSGRSYKPPSSEHQESCRADLFLTGSNAVSALLPNAASVHMKLRGPTLDLAETFRHVCF